METKYIRCFTEIKDTYVGREDCLVSVFVSFGIPDKKFGPAEDDEERSARKILTITERFSLPEGEDPKKSIAERVFDLEEESIKLKFHREKDRILSQVDIDIFNIIDLQHFYYTSIVSPDCLLQPSRRRTQDSDGGRRDRVCCGPQGE